MNYNKNSKRIKCIQLRLPKNKRHHTNTLLWRTNLNFKKVCDGEALEWAVVFVCANLLENAADSWSGGSIIEDPE